MLVAYNCLIVKYAIVYSCEPDSDGRDARRRTSGNQMLECGFVAKDVRSPTEPSLTKPRMLNAIWKQRLCFSSTAWHGKLHGREADHEVYVR